MIQHINSAGSIEGGIECSSLPLALLYYPGRGGRSAVMSSSTLRMRPLILASRARKPLDTHVRPSCTAVRWGKRFVTASKWTVRDRLGRPCIAIIAAPNGIDVQFRTSCYSSSSVRQPGYSILLRNELWLLLLLLSHPSASSSKCSALIRAQCNYNLFLIRSSIQQSNLN